MNTTARVSKWGNSLAVRLPKKLVNETGLKAGDEVELRPIGANRVEVLRHDSRREAAIERMRARGWPVPEGYRFDREEANER